MATTARRGSCGLGWGASGAAPPWVMSRLVAESSAADRELGHQWRRRTSTRRRDRAGGVVGTECGDLGFEVREGVEGAVDAGETEVGHLVELPQRSQNGQPNLVRRDFGAAAGADGVLHPLRQQREGIFLGRSALAGLAHASEDLGPAEWFGRPTPLDHGQAGGLHGGEPTPAVGARAPRGVGWPAAAPRLSTTRESPCRQNGHLIGHPFGSRRPPRGGRLEPKGCPMRCPFCRQGDSRVVDSREADDGQAIRRRRACANCGRRFTTMESASLTVVKRSGATEPFSRAKVLAGVRKACQGRPAEEDALALLAQRVEDAIRARGSAEVAADEVGLAILGPLRELDEVAYLRFASVYRAFDSLADFEAEIAALRAHHPTGPIPAPDIDPAPPLVAELAVSGG